jgi:phage gpG-like protein
MIEFKVNPDSVRNVLNKVEGATARVEEKVQGTMTRLMVELRSRVTQKLSGQVLKIRTGNLIRSVNNSVTRILGVIAGFVRAGREAPYGKIHEYGGTFSVAEYLRQLKSGKQAIVRAHTVTFPQRSFMRTSLFEMQSQIISEVSTAVTEGLK